MSTESLEPRITKIEDTMQSLEHTLGEVKSLLTTMSNLLEGTMGQDGLIVKHNDLSLRHFQLEREMNECFSNMERTLIEELSKSLPELETHHEVHLFLKLLRKRTVPSAVIDQVAKLLDHDKFFVGRRAFWYLDERELSPPQRKKVDAFFEKHQDRL